MQLPSANLRTTQKDKLLLENSLMIASALVYQSVSKKLPTWAIRHKLGISELWSKGVCGPTLKAPDEIQGKAPKDFAI